MVILDIEPLLILFDLCGRLYEDREKINRDVALAYPGIINLLSKEVNVK